MTAVAGDVQQRASTGLVGSFFSGVLATAVATPCTGPFLGTAVGLAVTLPPLFALLIFTSVGLGMASPYLALTAFPALLRYLPKPGAWMVVFKELMGFLMLGTVLWLTWVFSAQTDNLALHLLLGSFFMIALACWIYGKWGHSLKTRGVRLVGLFLTAVCLVAAGYTISLSVRTDGKGASQEVLASDWEPFSMQRIEELQRQGTPVFVDFTAKWCILCQANHLALSTQEVEAAFKQAGVVKMKADWTKGDPEIAAALKQYGRNSVPLYLLYQGHPGEPAKILPQVLTPDLVIEHLNGLKTVLAERESALSTPTPI